MEVYRQEPAPPSAFYRLRPRWTVRPGLSRAGSLWIAKSLKVGREVRFRRSIDYAHWRLIEADPEVASFCEEPVWADGPSGPPLADLCIRRADGTIEFLRVERSERGGAAAREGLRVVFGAAVRCRSVTAAQILADPVRLDNAARVVGHASTPAPAQEGDLAQRVEGLLAGGALRLGKLLDLLGPELGEGPALGTICRLFLRGKLHLGLRGVPLSARTEVHLRGGTHEAFPARH
jgi:hypothetical protein